jgi:hypothetical protein
MPVVTTDALVEGVRREKVMEWLSEPRNHGRALAEAFSSFSPDRENSWRVELAGPPRPVKIHYIFDRPDTSHSGRRILCKIEGKRVEGSLKWSLRTEKPSTNTRVTLHHDYKAGRFLGPILDAAGTRQALESAWQNVVNKAAAEIMRDLK